MSSVDFSGSIWPWELSTNSVFEEVIIWILVVFSMVILSSLTVYHFYRLFQMGSAPPLRRRNVLILLSVVAVVLMDFLIVEPLYLLCGAYASSVAIAHGLYLTLSTISYHVLVHSVLLRVWTLYFDTKWVDVCCLSGNEWRHHILNPSVSASDSENDQKRTDSATAISDRKETELEEEEIHSLRHKKSNSLSPQSTPDQSNDLNPDGPSWFVRRRETFGTVHFGAKCCALSATISIAVHLLILFFLNNVQRAVTLYAVDGVPVALICSLWIAMPDIADYGTLSGRTWWRSFIILAAVTTTLQIVIKVIVSSTDSSDSALSILTVVIRLCTDFGATLCLLWYPRWTRHRELLQSVATGGERAHSMSFQIEMTDGKEPVIQTRYRPLPLCFISGH